MNTNFFKYIEISIFIIHLFPSNCYSSLPPDTGLNVTQIIQRHGYPSEIHNVITEDGYILEMHRIPYGRKSPLVSNDPRPIALIQVGLWCASAAWVDMGPEKALGFLLADRGYDVWMGNTRGSTYSRRHVKLNPDIGSEFWQFSFHEMGVYDLPAMIDYALKETGQTKLSYVGHSQGSTIMYILLSEKPEYNTKLKIGISLAPATYMTHVKNPFLKHLADNIRKLELTFKLLGINELMRRSDAITETSKLFCNDDAPTQNQCATAFFLFAGFDRAQLNQTMIPVITTNAPAGSSVKQMLHFMQEVKSGKFRQYDYGKRKNRKIYGTDEPPEYEPKQITAPIAVFFADNDWMTSEEDIVEYTNQLPNLVHRYRVKYPYFNHIDFMWAIDVVPLVYIEMFAVMDRYL